MEMHSTLPSKRRVKRMTKRQFKKNRLGPFSHLVLKIQFTLSRSITEVDCLNTSAFPRSTEWGPDDYLSEWFVDLVEQNHVYCYFSTSPVDTKSLTYEAYIEADGWGIKAKDSLMAFARIFSQHELVNDFRFALIDSYRWDDDLNDQDHNSSFVSDLNRVAQQL